MLDRGCGQLHAPCTHQIRAWVGSRASLGAEEKSSFCFAKRRCLLYGEPLPPCHLYTQPWAWLKISAFHWVITLLETDFRFCLWILILLFPPLDVCLGSHCISLPLHSCLFVCHVSPPIDISTFWYIISANYSFCFITLLALWATSWHLTLEHISVSCFLACYSRSLIVWTVLWTCWKLRMD